MAVFACAVVAGGGSWMDKRAECRAKSDSSAKRISDREARKGGVGGVMLRQVGLDDGNGDVGFWGEVCAVEKGTVESVEVVLGVDERWKSWGKS